MCSCSGCSFVSLNRSALVINSVISLFFIKFSSNNKVVGSIVTSPADIGMFMFPFFTTSGMDSFKVVQETGIYGDGARCM